MSVKAQQSFIYVLITTILSWVFLLVANVIKQITVSRISLIRKCARRKVLWNTFSKHIFYFETTFELLKVFLSFLRYLIKHFFQLFKLSNVPKPKCFLRINLKIEKNQSEKKTGLPLIPVSYSNLPCGPCCILTMKKEHNSYHYLYLIQCISTNVAFKGPAIWGTVLEAIAMTNSSVAYNYLSLFMILNHLILSCLSRIIDCFNSQ